jgi:hypothetical protein
MPFDDDPKKRGRRRTAKSVLRPDGLTQEQYELLRGIAEETGLTIADVKRQMVREQLSSAGFTEEQQGLGVEYEEDDD